MKQHDVKRRVCVCVTFFQCMRNWIKEDIYYFIKNSFVSLKKTYLFQEEILFSLSHRLLLFSSFSFLFPSHFVFLVSDFLFHFFFSSLRFCESSVSHRPKLNNLFFILLTVTLRVRDLEAYTCFFHLLSLLFTCMFSFRHVIFHC